MLPPERWDGCAVCPRACEFGEGGLHSGSRRTLIWPSACQEKPRGHGVPPEAPGPHSTVFRFSFCLFSFTFELWLFCREERSAHCTNEDAEAQRT